MQICVPGHYTKGNENYMKFTQLMHAFLCMTICFLLNACGGGSGSSTGSNGTTPPTLYTLGGTVTGLNAGTNVVFQLVVSNSGNTSDTTNTVTITGNGSFVTPAYVPAGGNYIVLVATQPTGEICTVSNGSGTSVVADVNSISVVCSATTYSVSVTATGLLAGQQVTLLNNNADPLSISANGQFVFATPVALGGGYSVTIKTVPLASTCAVNGATGTNVSADVTSITVICGAAAKDGWVASLGSSTTDASQPEVGLVYDPTTGLFYGVSGLGGTNNTGAIFSLSATGTENVIYNFGSKTGTDGWCPQAPLILGSDGNFYGTTCHGGTGGDNGTIFQLTPSGTETILYSFTGGTADGAHPYAALIQASDGNLYGTTGEGGAYGVGGYGTVFTISTSGTGYKVLHSFGAGGDGRFPHSSLLQGADGNLYGITDGGGTSGLGAIYQLSTAGGSDVVLHSFASGTDGNMTPPGLNPHNQGAALVQYSDGYLYGTTPTGGQFGYGTVFKVNSAGSYSVVYTFGSAPNDAQDSQAGLLLANDGYFYGTSILGGANNAGTVFRISAAGTENVMYSFGPGDGQNPVGGLIQGPDGRLYGTTFYGGLNSQGIIFKL